jgi:N-acetylmuramoyl-L-alanine amidase
MKRWIAAGGLGVFFLLLLISCAANKVNHMSPDLARNPSITDTESPSPAVGISSAPTVTMSPSPTTLNPEPLITPNPIPNSGASSKPDQVKPKTRFIICIDPGHQESANNDLEDQGPGSKTKKPKVSSGTQGIVTKKPEYVLNLEISLLLKKKLVAKGYQVVMTRETPNVNLSNKDRADIANNAHADLFVRIHADGNQLESTHGISIQYPAANVSFSSDVYKTSKAAAATILNAMIKAAGALSRGIVPRSDLSGFNWAKTPSILVEMGFMTNPDEDVLMSKPEYQEELADGMAKGIDQLFAERG